MYYKQWKRALKVPTEMGETQKYMFVSRENQDEPQEKWEASSWDGNKK